MICRWPLSGEAVTLAVSEVSPSYEGACKLLLDDKPGPVFSSYVQACKAASYAIKPDGGYQFVIVKPAEGQEVSHSTWMEWAL